MKTIVLLLALLVACATLPSQNGVPNLKQVEPGVWRGGQPTTSGWDYLKSIGVTNDVKLDTWRESKYAWTDSYARKIGITVDDREISLMQQLIKVDGTNLMAAVNDIKPGTFVHCLRGQDRTGLAVALYRLKTGWTKEAAENEMMTNGFHKTLHGLWDFWEDYGTK